MNIKTWAYTIPHHTLYNHSRSYATIPCTGYALSAMPILRQYLEKSALIDLPKFCTVQLTPTKVIFLLTFPLFQLQLLPFHSYVEAQLHT